MEKKMKIKKLQKIHNSLVNGQRKQMTEQIKEYGTYDFFNDYAEFLKNSGHNKSMYMAYYTDCVVSFHRILNR